MFQEVEGQLSGKTIGLFGSYDWGDGSWMREWQDRVVADGANLIQEGVIANLTPDEEGLEACRQLGAALVKYVNSDDVESSFFLQENEGKLLGRSNGCSP